MSENIDLSALINALAELEGMYKRALSLRVDEDPDLFRYLRTAVVKGYEYTYGLTLKFIERFLETYDTKKLGEEKPTFREFLHHAKEFGLIQKSDSWLDHRDMRNKTSHGYKEETADIIFNNAPVLIADARYSLEAMRRRMKEVS